MKLFTATKSSQRNWTKRFLYITAVSDACEGADNLVLGNIVHYAEPTMRTTMLSRLDCIGSITCDKLKSWRSSHNRGRSTSVSSSSAAMLRALWSRARMSRKLNQSRNDLGIKAKKDATSVKTRDTTSHPVLDDQRKNKTRISSSQLVMRTKVGPKVPPTGCWTVGQGVIWSIT